MMTDIHEWHLTRVSSTIQIITYWDLGKKVIDVFIFEKLIEYTSFSVPKSSLILGNNFLWKFP